MRITYVGVRKWLQSNAGFCTVEQLDELWRCIEEGRAKATDKRKNEEVVLEAQALAEKAGLTVEELFSRVLGSTTANRTGPTRISSVRKPYMDPFSEGERIYAVLKRHPKPAWLLKAEEKGWSLEECHYRVLAQAWKARGMKPLFDPVLRHKELSEEDGRRIQKVRAKKHPWQESYNKL